MTRYGKFKHFNVYDEYDDPPEPDYDKEGYVLVYRTMQAGPATGVQLAHELDDALNALFSGTVESVELRDCSVNVEKTPKGKPKLEFFLEITGRRKMTSEEKKKLKEEYAEEEDKAFKHHQFLVKTALKTYPAIRQMVLDGEL